jgi:hypothetical protein
VIERWRRVSMAFPSSALLACFYIYTLVDFYARVKAGEGRERRGEENFSKMPNRKDHQAYFAKIGTALHEEE